MRKRFIYSLLALLMLPAVASVAQSKAVIDSIIDATQYIGKGEDIVDFAGKSKLVSVPYYRKTNNNIQYTDSSAAVAIQSIYVMLKNGADFHDLAINYSQDPGSYKGGGLLKPTTMEDYVNAFRDTILGLDINEFSAPFKTDFGYHVAQLIAVRDGVYTTRHILLRVD